MSSSSELITMKSLRAMLILVSTFFQFGTFKGAFFTLRRADRDWRNGNCCLGFVYLGTEKGSFLRGSPKEEEATEGGGRRMPAGSMTGGGGGASLRLLRFLLPRLSRSPRPLEVGGEGKRGKRNSPIPSG